MVEGSNLVASNGLCDICGKPATQWMGDPWGKSDVKRPKCAEHGLRLRDPADVAKIELLKMEVARLERQLIAEQDGADEVLDPDRPADETEKRDG